jgi:hypothetical protein
MATKILNTDLTEEAYERLQEIITRKNLGSTITVVLGKALGLAAFYSKETSDGFKIIAEKQVDYKVFRKQIVSI